MDPGTLDAAPRASPALEERVDAYAVHAAQGGDRDLVYGSAQLR